MLQLCTIALLALGLLATSKKQPDVVLLSSDGKGTYVARTAASEALVRFLDDQRRVPPDFEVASFSRGFLEKCVAVNSSTIDEAWGDCLDRMDDSLKRRSQEDAAKNKLINTYKLAQVRTHLGFDELALVERSGGMLHLHAALTRTRMALLGAEAQTTDHLEVELFERVVPRGVNRPDGLEVADWRLREVVGAETEPKGADHAH
jgi:hypothetical protein